MTASPPAPLFLSRVSLRRDVPAQALAPILLPAEPGARLGATHRLIWAMFPSTPDAERDFLWREEGRGELSPGRASFLILSKRPPVDAHGLFTIDEPKPFTPVLRPGDRLAFALRANPVVARSVPGSRARSRRHDIVMDRLSAIPKGDERAERRREVMIEAAHAWLTSQGERTGFCLDEPAGLRVEGYHRLRIPREQAPAVAVSVLDLEGRINVTDPGRFVPALAAGFGKAKAFGCGLMLIRRG